MKYYISRIVSFLSAVVLALGAFNVNAFAYTENHITNQVRVKTGTELNESTAPKLIIESSKDHTDDFNFEVYIDNAKWSDKYSDKGDIETGVSYTKISDTRMIFNVDLDTFDATSKDIEIPLYTVIDDFGDATVGINSKGSSVSEGEFVFATAGASDIKIYNEPVENMKENGTINEILIQDDFNSSVKSGTKYTIKLNGSFTFAELPKMDNDGKYSNKTDIDFVDSSKKAIVITVTKTTDAGKGSIKLTDIKLNTENASYGNIKADFTNSNGGSAELNFGTFGTGNETASEIMINDNINYTDDKAVLTGTATKGKFVVLNIDNKEIGKIRVDDNGAWQFEFDKTLINDGNTHNIQLGYYNTDTKDLYYVKTIEYSKNNSINIVYAIGAEGYVYNGKQVVTDGVPYIDESGRTMIPLRTFSNSMGISDTDIAWNEKTGEITIKTTNGNISLKIGETKITSPNGEINIDCPAVIKDNRTYIPLRGVLNAYGISDENIEWSPSAKTITIFK